MSIKNFTYPFYIIGLDIGGTKIAGGVLLYKNSCTQPQIIYKHKILSKAHKGVDTLLKNICEQINLFVKTAKEYDSSINILAVGLGTSGKIHKENGSIDAATDNFPGCINFKLSDAVKKACGIETFAINDVQAYTLGEAKWGIGRDVDNFILLAIGTGIGGAVVSNGKLIKGKRGYAGELGHVQVSLGNDVPCACGKVGHLEGTSSGRGIERLYKAKTGNDLSCYEIAKLSEKGKKEAVDIISFAARNLGRVLGMYQSMFDPEFIVLCGSVMSSGKVWDDALNLGVDEEILPELKKNFKIKNAKLGEDAPIVGVCENAIECLEFKDE